jgi:hypothetical protein
MKVQTQFRVLLNSTAQDAVIEMIKVLKESGNFLKINPSNLVSWIVDNFKKDSFEKRKDEIIQDHFNSKEYLHNLATKIQSSDDAANILAEALQKIQKRSKRVNVKKSKNEKTTKEV